MKPVLYAIFVAIMATATITMAQDAAKKEKLSAVERLQVLPNDGIVTVTTKPGKHVFEMGDTIKHEIKAKKACFFLVVIVNSEEKLNILYVSARKERSVSLPSEQHSYQLCGPLGLETIMVFAAPQPFLVSALETGEVTEETVKVIKSTLTPNKKGELEGQMAYTAYQIVAKKANKKQ